MFAEGVCLAFAYEELGSPEQLAALLRDLRLLDGAAAVRSEELDEARALAAAISRCARAACTDGRLADRDVQTVNDFAGEQAGLVLLRDGSARIASADPVRGALAALARDAIAIIAGRRGRLRRCEGEGCGRVFLDLSRAGARRWCSMERCGNREKVRAYRGRRS